MLVSSSAREFRDSKGAPKATSRRYNSTTDGRTGKACCDSARGAPSRSRNNVSIETQIQVSNRRRRFGSDRHLTIVHAAVRTFCARTLILSQDGYGSLCALTSWRKGVSSHKTHYSPEVIPSRRRFRSNSWARALWGVAAPIVTDRNNKNTGQANRKIRYIMPRCAGG
jgi:hypothetical protein